MGFSSSENKYTDYLTPPPSILFRQMMQYSGFISIGVWQSPYSCLTPINLQPHQHDYRGNTYNKLYHILLLLNKQVADIGHFLIRLWIQAENRQAHENGAVLQCQTELKGFQRLIRKNALRQRFINHDFNRMQYPLATKMLSKFSFP